MAERLLPYRGMERRLPDDEPWENALFVADTQAEIDAALALKRAQNATVTAATGALEFDFDPSEARDAGGRWTAGSGQDGRDKLYDALRDAGRFGPNGAESLWRGRSKASAEEQWPGRAERISDVSDEQRGAAKSTIVTIAGQDIAAAVRNDPTVAAEMEAQFKVYGDNPVTDEERRYALERDWMDQQTGNWTREELDAKDNTTLYGEIKAQQYVDSWANSAADSNEISLALQLTTANVLDAHSSSFDEYLGTDESSLHMPLDDDGNPLMGTKVGEVLEEQGNTMSAFVRGEYDRTQAYLKANDTDSVTVYRGISFGEYDPPSPFHSDGQYKIDMNPASSWSVDREVAENFASNDFSANNFVLTATIPAEDIISTAATGRGALSEGEVLVRNQPDTVAHVERLA